VDEKIKQNIDSPAYLANFNSDNNFAPKTLKIKERIEKSKKFEMIP
jgi:hypothetical protein